MKKTTQKHLVVSSIQRPIQKIGMYSILALNLILFTRCSNDDPDKPKKTNEITPVSLPVVIKGFHFPEDSNKILGWVNDSTFAPSNYDSVNIYKHAWGIWAGLTNPTNQTVGGDPLLVFETWMGLNEVRNLIQKDKSACDKSYKKTERTQLTRAKQFEHAFHFKQESLSKEVKSSSGKKSGTESSTSQWVTVSYNPEAACFATQTQIFKQSKINSYYKKGGIGQIPDFPNTAITIKPTYLVFHTTDKLLKMPVWLDAPNPPDSVLVNNFPYCVYVDVENKQKPNKKLVPVLQSETNKKAIANATCNLTDFIYFKVDKKMAGFMNKQDSVQGMNNDISGGAYGKAKAGEIAILVGMHVSTKEISNWTWQSYYWTPNPENPGSPSSKLAARTRPTGLKGAAGHYAATAAYVMVTPNNSPTGTGSMFGYNPYLEGGFGPTTFTFPNTFNANYKYGMQTNCMSCHAIAIPNSTGQYTTDQNIDLNDPRYFNGEVKLDFAWSIQTAIIKDTVPYWLFK